MIRRTALTTALALAVAAGRAPATEASFHRVATDGSPDTWLDIPALRRALLLPGTVGMNDRLVVGIDANPMIEQIRVFEVFDDDAVVERDVTAPPRVPGAEVPVTTFALGQRFGAVRENGDIDVYSNTGGNDFTAVTASAGVVPPELTHAVAYDDLMLFYDAVFYSPDGDALHVAGVELTMPATTPFTLPLAAPGADVRVTVGARTTGSYPDLLVTSPLSRAVAVVRGSGSPATAPVLQVATGSTGSLKAVATDADSDMIPDIVTVNVDGTLSLLLGTGTDYVLAPGSPLLIGTGLSDVAPTSAANQLVALHGATGRATVRVPPATRRLTLASPGYQPGEVVALLDVDPYTISWSSLLEGIAECGSEGPQLIGRLRSPWAVVIDVEPDQELCLADELSRLPGVVAAEPNWRAHTRRFDATTSSDWARQALNLPPTAGAAGVVLAVVDSGVEGLGRRRGGRGSGRNRNEPLWRNPAEVVNGLDDDGNGYIDDVDGVDWVDGGWTESGFLSGPGALVDAVPEGHGSAVAAAAVAVAPGVQVMSLKVIDSDNDTTATRLAMAVAYATDHGAQIINLSLAGPSYSELLHQAIRRAWEHGVVVVAATGNDGHSSSVAYPALFDEAVAVGAVGPTETVGVVELWPGTNRGNGAGFLAPGVDVCTATRCDTGTSMAAALVSGVLALAAAANPPLCPDDVQQVLRETAVDFLDVGWDPATGYGAVDAAAAVAEAKATLPSCAPAPPPAPLPAREFLGPVEADAHFGGVVQFHGLMND